jgi:hypothetical protein
MTALRLGGGVGCALLACLASWWLCLASPRLAVGGHPTEVADAALRAYTVVAALWLVLAAPRLGVAHGARAAFGALLVALLLPAPLLALLWSAGTLPARGLLLALACGTGLAAALPALARRAHAALPRQARLATDLVPLLIAALVWRGGASWLAALYA